MPTNIKLTQWADFILPITLRNPSTTVGIPGTPINLTGFSATGCVIKGWKAAERYPFFFTFDPDRTTGKVTAQMTAAQIGAIAYGIYLYEIKIIDSAGKTVRILTGNAEIVPGKPNL